MNYRLLIQQCIGNLWARKLRSILLMLGIIWGTFAITLLLTIGQSFRQTNQQAFLNIADGSLIVWLQTTTMPYRGLPPGRRIELKSADVMELGKALPSIGQISPASFQEEEPQLQYAGKTAKSMVTGVGANFSALANLHLKPGGRFFNEQDLMQGRRVIVMGHELAQELFGKKDPIDKMIVIKGQPFRVIGVLKDDNVRMFLRNPRSSYIPYTSYNNLWGDQIVNLFWVQPKNLTQIDSTTSDIYFYLSKRFHFEAHDESVLGIWDTSEVRQFIDGFFGLIEIFLGFCGLLALIVGGIGVANTLFLIVRERTTEIGLCLAIGARPHHILQQFLFESLIIVFLAGGIGFLLSALVIGLINLLPTQSWLGELAFTPSIVLIILSLLTGIGLAAGYFPAKRAAKMTPVQALGFV